MRHLALIVLAASVLPGAALAQTYGQPHYGQHPHGPAPYGQVTYGHPGLGGGAAYGDPRAYRPPVQHRADRGGRYGYSSAPGQWNRWSSPPGRGYHDVYGYNDDRPPRGSNGPPDRGRRTDCDCGYGPYLRDR